MEARSPGLDSALVSLLGGALWLVIAGAALALHGLLAGGPHGHVASGRAVLGSVGTAAALGLLLLGSAD